MAESKDPDIQALKENQEQVKKATRTGRSSPFTHEDDSVASVHTSVPGAVEGGLTSEDTHIATIAFGPPAFGSPDPATLGNVLLTEGDEMMGGSGEVDSDEMSKEEMVEEAKARGVRGASGMTKDELAKELNQ